MCLKIAIITNRKSYAKIANVPRPQHGTTESKLFFIFPAQRLKQRRNRRDTHTQDANAAKSASQILQNFQTLGKSK